MFLVFSRLFTKPFDLYLEFGSIKKNKKIRQNKIQVAVPQLLHFNVLRYFYETGKESTAINYRYIGIIRRTLRHFYYS